LLIADSHELANLEDEKREESGADLKASLHYAGTMFPILFFRKPKAPTIRAADDNSITKPKLKLSGIGSLEYGKVPQSFGTSRDVGGHA